MSTGAVELESAAHIYRTPSLEVFALRGVDLAVSPGQTVALVGPSGSGKSTLLLLLAGLLRPSAGTVRVAGQDLGKLGERDLLALRRTHVGVLLQGSGRNLLPYASVEENLTFAQRRTRLRPAERRRRRAEVLAAVGLDTAGRRRAALLSGGEQQRLALAVALAAAPSVLLADEPTSQLDEPNARLVAGLLRDTRDRFGTTVIAVTHDERLAEGFDRTVAMRDGRIGAEARSGSTRRFAVVGRDGSVQLPAELLGDFAPGTFVEVLQTADGVELRPRRREEHE